MKFKIGDICKPKKGYEGKCGAFHCYTEGAYAIKIIDVDNGYSYDILNKNLAKVNSCGTCFKDEYLELLKPIGKINYILIYDTLDRDPVEYFEKLSEVENKIEELTRSNGALLDTIKIYGVKSVGKVEGIKINITFKK